MTMTFKEFKASGVVVDKLSDHAAAACDNEWHVPGRLYLNGDLMIEGPNPEYGYCLMIGNCEYTRPIEQLEELERILYAWAEGEGYFD